MQAVVVFIENMYIFTNLFF